MAHNILGHSSAGDAHGLLALFGFGASKVRREETEADEFAVPLMSAGGFAPTSAIQLLQNVARCRWWDISFDHPGFGERIRTVSAVIARMPPART
jgi:predicted Zn-dependent protease